MLQKKENVARDLLAQVNPQCAALHLGLWSCDIRWLQEAVASIRARLWLPREPRGDAPRAARAEVLAQGVPDEPTAPARFYAPPSNGIALLSLDGPLMKAWSKFGGTSTVWMRQAIRAAVADPAVRAILLRVDSPGGTIPGTEELARDVANANAKKPVMAHIDDMGASGAYWPILGARKITANATARVGSIGAMAVIEDTSGALKAEGIVVRVYSTGPLKGAFVPGAEIAPEHEAYLQKMVDDYGKIFFNAVSAGRKLEGDRLAAVTTGQDWLAPEAKKLGLIDAVQPMDATVADLIGLLDAQDARGAKLRRARIATARG